MTRPVSRSVLALAVVLTVLAGQFAVHMLQLARKGEHRDFAAVYTAAHVFRSGGEFYDPQLDRETGLNHNAVLIEAAKRLGTLHAHDDFVHIHAFSYPPFTALAFTPFTALSFQIKNRIGATDREVLDLGMTRRLVFRSAKSSTTRRFTSDRHPFSLLKGSTNLFPGKSSN